MSFSLNMIKIMYIIGTWLCGSILNSTIVAVYLRGWKIRKVLGECDRTILAMGCTNLFLQCLLTIHDLIHIFQLYGLFFKTLIVVSYIFFFFLSSLSMWLTACLSLCYCVKLVNISHGLFIRLKRVLSSAITLYLVASVLISCLINIPFIWKLDIEFLQNSTLDDNVLFKVDIKFIWFNIGIGCCVPVLGTSLCIGLSVISLLRHVQRMKKNTSQSWNPQLKSHVRASRTMSFLLILNLIFFSTVITMTIGLTQSNNVIVRHLYWTVIMTNPSAEAIILITGNNKLKMALSKICS